MHVQIPRAHRYVKLINSFDQRTTVLESLTLIIHELNLKFFLAKSLLEFVSGIWTTCASRDGNKDVEIEVKLEDIFDPVILARIDHTTLCTFCRRLWTTLQYRHNLGNDQVWAGLVAEFFKLLSSAGVQCKD